MRTRTIEQVVDEYYGKLFNELTDIYDEFFDLVVEVRIKNDGKTIRRSWRDRDLMFWMEEHPNGKATVNEVATKH